MTLAIAGGLGAIAGLQDLSGLDIFDRAFAGTLTVDEGNAFDTSFALMGTLQLVLIVVAAIALLAWLWRSVANVPGLGGGIPVATPGWAVAWWFIPFANLVKPYQIVADLYRRMAPSERIGTGIVLAWWVVWLLGNIVGQLASMMYNAAFDLEPIKTSLMVWAVSDFSDLVAAALAIVIILRIQGWADARQAAAGAGLPAGLGEAEATVST